MAFPAELHIPLYMPKRLIVEYYNEIRQFILIPNDWNITSPDERSQFTILTSKGCNSSSSFVTPARTTLAVEISNHRHSCSHHSCSRELTHRPSSRNITSQLERKYNQCLQFRVITSPYHDKLAFSRDCSSSLLSTYFSPSGYSWVVTALFIHDHRFPWLENSFAKRFCEGPFNSTGLITLFLSAPVCRVILYLQEIDSDSIVRWRDWLTRTRRFTSLSNWNTHLSISWPRTYHNASSMKPPPQLLQI